MVEKDYFAMGQRWASKIRKSYWRSKFSDERVLKKMDELIEYWLTRGQLRMFIPMSWKRIGEHIQARNVWGLEVMGE